jgi:hypothetical protein
MMSTNPLLSTELRSLLHIAAYRLAAIQAEILNYYQSHCNPSKESLEKVRGYAYTNYLEELGRIAKGYDPDICITMNMPITSTNLKLGFVLDKELQNDS